MVTNLPTYKIKWIMESSFQLMVYCLNCVGMSFMLSVCVSHAMLLLLNLLWTTNLIVNAILI
jgi:hypothetical protein